MAQGLVPPHCPAGKACVRWVQRYLRDCVCGVRDEVSLALGLISVFSWAVAELPQIFTNFVSQSAEGVSLGFLMSWIVGDSFNLIGCLLEPATLPTQFYSALWYTIVTVILALQTIYYNYIYQWWRARKMRLIMKKQPNHSKGSNQSYDGKGEPLNADVERSTRSLASNHTPIISSYPLASCVGCGRSNPNYTLNQSSTEAHEGLLTNHLVATSPRNTNTALLRIVIGVTFFVGGINFHLHGHNNTTSSSHARLLEKGFVTHSGRKLLQEINGIAFKDSLKQDVSSSSLGTYLGWLMAVIYIGGRLPQIYLNNKRGKIKGLNPLMFTFAVIGNATYIGSIIVRTIEWERIKPNLPWLVYTTICMLLDCSILIQFIYYRTQNAIKYADDNGDYEVANDYVN